MARLSAAERRAAGVRVTGQWQFASSHVREPSEVSAHRRMRAIGAGDLSGLTLAGGEAGLLAPALAAALERGRPDAPATIDLGEAFVRTDALLALDAAGLAVLRTAIAESAQPQQERVFQWLDEEQNQALLRLLAPLRKQAAWAVLKKAAAQGRYGAVRALLAAGIRPDRRGSMEAKGEPPLHQALIALGGERTAIHRHLLPIIHRLLHAGADPNQPAHQHGVTPLTLLLQTPLQRNQSRERRIERAARMLLAAGATPHPKDYQPLPAAAGAGRAWAVRLLVEHGAPVSEDDGSATLMCRAVQSPRPLQTMQALAEAGSPVAGVSDWWGSLLHQLAGNECADADALRFLLDHGLAIDEIGQKRTPLMQAVGANNLSMVEALLDAGAAIDATDPDGKTALMRACILPEGTEAATRLLRRGADPCARDASGWTPLFYAARHGNKELVRHLLANGADATAVDEQGYTAAHHVYHPRKDQKGIIERAITRAQSSPRHASGGARTV